MKPSGIVFYFALSYSKAFKDFNVCHFNLLWYFNYHLFAHFAKALLACSFLSKQCCLNCDCFEFRAIVESFCFDYFYVSFNGSFGKFFTVFESVGSNAGYLVGNTFSFNCTWNSDGSCLSIGFAKAYLRTDLCYCVLISTNDYFSSCLWHWELC